MKKINTYLKIYLFGILYSENVNSLFLYSTYTEFDMLKMTYAKLIAVEAAVHALVHVCVISQAEFEMIRRVIRSAVTIESTAKHE